MNAKRVAITGVGPVSAIGIGREAFADGLRRGDSGIAAVTAFDTAKYRSKLAAELRDFHVEDYLESSKTYLDRASEIAFAAMALALADAELEAKTLDRTAAGLMLGSAAGSQETTRLFFTGLLEKGPRFVKPVLFPNTYSNTAISLLAIEHRIEGVHLNFAAGFISASCALLAAYDRIRQGREQVIFAGGCDALSEVVFAGYELTGALSPGKGGEERCAPFDRRRNGFVLGEGGGILVLEELEHAQARHARIHGEILGGGLAGDDDGEGMVRAMRLALTQAQLAPRDIGFISANANGSPAGDGREAAGILSLLNSHGPYVPVTSIKPLLGETLGAGGALQAIAALWTLDTESVPGILNLKEPEDGLHFVQPPGFGEATGSALLNSIDPGGAAVSLVVARA